MISISLEEAIERIEKIDTRSREDRAKRLSKLGAYSISLVERPVANLMEEYLKEASYSYVYGNFRSCIFACSAAVDQIFRHEIIHKSNEYKTKIKQIEELSFGRIIGVAREEKIESLRSILNEAGWINEARNRIAVHPICITAEKLDEELTNELKIEYINNIIEIADEEEREKILSMNLTYPGIKRVTIQEVLENPYIIRASDLLMWEIDNEVIELIALESYKKTVRILLHLFPAD